MTSQQTPLAEDEMKVFRYISSIPKHVDLPVTKHVEQCALVVAAPTKKRAIELFAATGVDCSQYLLRTYGSGEPTISDVLIANQQPELVFARPIADTTPYIPVMSLEEQAALDAQMAEQARYDEHCDDVAAGERDRREQRALEEYENELDDGVDAFDLRDEICGYPV